MCTENGEVCGGREASGRPPSSPLLADVALAALADARDAHHSSLHPSVTPLQSTSGIRTACPARPAPFVVIFPTSSRPALSSLLGQSPRPPDSVLNCALSLPPQSSCGLQAQQGEQERWSSQRVMRMVASSLLEHGGLRFSLLARENV